MSLTWEDLVNKQFRRTKFAEGYLIEDVDDYLDDVSEEVFMDAWVHGRGAGRPGVDSRPA